MPRKKSKPISRVDELSALVNNLTGLNWELAKDMLTEYVFMVEQMEELKATIRKEGIVTTVLRGALDNQREIEEESKYFLAYQRLVPKVIATAAAIKKFCKDNETESIADDGFDEF